MAAESLAQFRILRSHTHRAGVEMALALHHTSQHDHYAGGKTELLGSEQRTEDHVASRFELSVYLQGNKTAQVVEYKRLLYLGKPQFGWHPGMANRTGRTGARTAFATADEDHVGLGLGHAGGHRPYAQFRNELDADTCRRIDVLQVEN